ncbi:MerR family transcriptional regulator [Virgisporangium aurantiacum]|uniref:MerR family transcriptional regulator n=1 Tax=Virgisporangium aurantiacum TaxID=175570 RepID=A0A8J3Z5N6_9ACTN|nr:MerR family transcriptional regulator [Virgisporangium aurantiacum]GIJ57871.1 MerR family transcriptional regulator [Virgisporangium aurantiacum]
MLSIGDFARHGRVSVRMLRHYDAIGLLRPARVDPSTGYRYYDAAQLPRLHRAIALKELGFTLEQVTAVLDEQVSVAELRGMLRLRRAQLQEQIASDAERLARVEARLLVIGMEGAAPSDEVTVTAVPAVRVAALSDLAPGFGPEHIGPVILPLYERLRGPAEAAAAGPPIAFYSDPPDGDGIVVHAAVPVAPGVSVDGCEMVDLPPIEAATIVHRGPMANIVPTAHSLTTWIDAHGYRSAGYSREIYHVYGTGDPDTWRTEVQEPVIVRAADG